MGIDTVGRTGEQCHMIFARHYLQRLFQCLHIVLVYHIQDLIHLVGKGLIQYMDVKHIALVELVDIGKKSCARQPSMRRQNAVGVVPADGKNGSVQMACARLEHLVGSSMVNGDPDVDLRD